MLDLYFFPTPNSRKVTILLEETGLPYRLKIVHIARGDQFHPDFLRISPNNRMPALVDDEPLGARGPGETAPIAIFESAAIMMYLAEKAGRFWPQEPAAKYDVVQWLYWQMANQGPKTGERGHFTRAAAEEGAEQKHGDLSYPLRRFNNEVHRIYGVLNLGLFERQWLAAGQYTIADMICYPWAASWQQRGIDLGEFPNVKSWLDELGARPAVKKAMAMGPEFREDPASITAEEKARRSKIVDDQRAQKVPASWG
jgi:GST-like protein